MAKSGQQTAQERRRQGKCCSCSQPATRGGRCETHWLEEKQRAAARYQARKAAGMCGMCGKRPKAEGKESCNECRENQNVPRRIYSESNPRPVFDKPYHQRNKEAGLCALGGEAHERPREGRTVCDACLEKKRARHAARAAKKQCRLCPAQATPGTRLCEACRESKKQQRVVNVTAGLCAECGKVPPAIGRKMCQPCNSDSIARNRDLRNRLRDAAIKRYGGYVCKCCGEDEPLFLHIDHINNDGASHRRELRKKLGLKYSLSSSRFYRWLKQNSYPEGFQVLCANCNLGKARNGGICPHKTQAGA